MRRGEIWRVRLPPAAGHVQAGERPALVIQNDSYTASLPTVLVVPLTGTLAASRFPGTLLIHPDPANGLTIPSVALVFQTRALDKSDLVARMGAVDPAILDQVVTILDQLTH
jgi:mRNA interferase MazF